MSDAIINVLIEKLVESLLNEGSHVLQFHKQFRSVNKELQLMQSYIKQVEKVRMKDHNPILKTVVGQLRELLYDAEDIISDCEWFLKSERRKKFSKLKRYCSPSFWKFRYQMGRKLSEINQEIRDHRERMRSFLPTAPVLTNQEQTGNNRGGARYPVLINDAELVGLNEDVKKIKQWILNSHGSLNIVGIVGMGGIGKTTIAQKIEDDSDVKNYFDHVLLETVSQTFKFEELTKQLLKKVSSESRDTANTYDLLRELKGLLKEKKCLVILDDVWRADEGLWWESLKSALPQSSSCVIVTTRNVEVACSMGATEMRIHRPKLLSDEDSWTLFAKTAFAREGGQCRNPDIEQIGREIVNRCKGLPLAIKVMGGMMLGRCSVEEWGRIAKNLNEELAKKGEPIASVLKLSYEDLPSDLKPCMLCLAAFSEDLRLSSEYIIEWWIGEGFVRRRDGERTAYEIGQDYLHELLSRGLLINRDLWQKNVFWFKVHDLIHSMIREIAKEEIFIFFNDKGRLSCAGSRRVGLVTNMNLKLFQEETNFKLLRAVIGLRMEENEEFIRDLGPKLCELKWLRVLNISFQNLSEPPAATSIGVDWLSGIGSLKHLVCFRIENSRTERLPNSIGNLQSLQILILSYFPNLKVLPKNIASLENLCTLDLTGCKSLECLPTEIGNLQQLCIFNFLVNSTVNNGFRISGLNKLTQLRELYLEITSEDGIEEGELNVLSALTQLEILEIQFPSTVNDKEGLLRKVNHELSPLQQLVELHLWLYPGEETPVWLNPTSLPNLRHLHIYEGEITQFSEEFYGRNEEDNNRIWKLEVLVLEQVDGMEEEWPRMQSAMPFLKHLRVLECPNLKSLPSDLDEDGGAATWRRKEDTVNL